MLHGHLMSGTRNFQFLCLYKQNIFLDFVFDLVLHLESCRWCYILLKVQHMSSIADAALDLHWS